MNEYIIPFSTVALRRKLIVSGIVALLACAILTLYFYFAVSSAPTLQPILLLTLWIGLPMLWALSVYTITRHHAKIRYVLTDDALIIRKKGLFGESTKKMYRYDNLISVTSAARAHGAYGSVELELEGQKSLVLSNIMLPDEQAKLIKQRAAAARSSVSIKSS